MVKVICEKKITPCGWLKEKGLWLLRTAGNNSGCHQLPEHSFFYKGKQFPVCARCTGVSIGQLLAVIVNVVFLMRKGYSSSNSILGNSAGRSLYALGTHAPLISAFCLSVMGADWLIQETKIKESTNPRRLLTGILGGFGLFNLYFILGQKLLSLFKSN